MSLKEGDGVDIKRLKHSLREKEEIINLYEERVAELLQSMKGLMKQKNALENTVKVFKSGLDGSGEVSALSNSLTALLEEKKRTESELRESKKKVIKELKEARSEIEDLRDNLSRKDAEAARQIQDIKSKLIVEQHERQLELQNHTSTLKELQKRLFEERSEKTKLIHEKEEGVWNINAAVAKSDSGSSKTVSADEINRFRKEMNEMELYHRQQLEKAELRAAEAEKRSAETQELQESRVVNLELRLEELSASVASYDRQRHEDQISIAKLRERIAQLDSENCALTHVRHQTESASFDAEEDEGLHSIVEKIIRLRSELRERNSKSENPINDIEAFFNEEKKDNCSESEDWKSKYFNLLDEFDAYKNVNSSLNNHSQSFKNLMKNVEVDQEEIRTLKSQVRDLKDKVILLRSSLSSTEEGKLACESKIRELNSEINNVKLTMSNDLQSKEVEMRVKTLTLETELVKQRDRFLLAMKEKEEELKNVRDNLEIAIDNGFVTYMNRKSSGNLGSTNIDNLTEKLSLATDDESKMMIHFSEETARKDKEIMELRGQIRDLESGMREIQARFINKEEDYVSEVESLQDRVAVLQRLSKSDFNVEYLKNVVVNYMLSSDISSKEHMLNAIAAVLVFSEKEVRKIKAFHNSWFWNKS